MTNCKYLKQKLNRKFECKLTKKIINIKECNNCKFRENKESNNHQIKNKTHSSSLKDSKKQNYSNMRLKSNKPLLKKRTYKQTKKEKQRYSIIYKDLTKCCVEGCLTPYYNVEKNEVYEGAKRTASIKNGFVSPFCKFHHDQFHNDRSFALYYKRMFQKEYERNHSRKDFLKIIHVNYLK